MNKRECRRYAEPELRFNLNSGVLHAKAIDYIIRTDVKNIDGRRTLLLYMYLRNEAAKGCSKPQYVVFQNKDAYLMLEHLLDGTIKWRTARFENLFVRKIKLAFYTAADENRVTKFCGITDFDGLSVLAQLQQNLANALEVKRIKARERKIIARMSVLPPLPRDLKGWIHREVLPAYIYYEYRKTTKPLDGFCTACKHEVSVIGAKHQAKGICPRCKKSVTFMSRKKTGSHVIDRDTIQVVQQISATEVVVRTVKAWRRYNDCRNPDVHVYETSRIFVKSEGTKDCKVEPYYDTFWRGLLTSWKKGDRPVRNQWVTNFNNEQCGHLYVRNLDAALDGTPWKYCQLKPYAIQINEPLEVVPYLRKYIEFTAIEYLFKLGLTELLCEAVYRYSRALNTEGKNMREILGVAKEDIPLLQEVNATGKILALVRAFRATGIRFDLDTLRWCQENDVHDDRNLSRILKLMTAHKMIRYIDQQRERMNPPYTSRVVSDYRDYLEMGSELGYDFSDEFVLFPRNLSEAHDTASALNNKRKAEIYNARIAGAYQALTEQYGFSNDTYAIIAPKSSAELTAEGHKLHHCVGTYARRIAEGESIVLFLRRTENLDEPFCTLEIKDGEITQKRGNKNCEVTPDVTAFLALWEWQVLHEQRDAIAA